MKYLIIKNFLSKEECAELIAAGQKKLIPATGVNAVTGQAELTEYRKAETSMFSIAETPLIDDIEHRIANIINLPIENGEGMQVIRYRPGGYYKFHFDAFNSKFEGDKHYIERAGNRIYTFLAYLNDVETGGETYFPKVDLKIKPEMGKAIFWLNLKADGSIDTDTNHSGEPVGEGLEKWIVTKWVRERAYK